MSGTPITWRRATAMLLLQAGRFATVAELSPQQVVSASTIRSGFALTM